jgi:mono/diheme cytochrome c family protein
MTMGDAMTRWNRAVVALAVLGLTPVAGLDAQQKRTLSQSDVEAIKALNVAYGTALGMCKYEEYASLYAAPDGYFASGPRGRVAGRERLVELSKSEVFCHDGSEKKARNLPSKVEVEATAEGAKGRVELAPTPGHYEDTYVKTSKGWRFKSHTYISTGEKAAGMTAADFEEIRKLAGNDSGQFQDVWADFPDGKRFRSSGVSIAAKAGAPITGRGLLADGGRYEDEYVKAASGWKFKSRKYTPPGNATASTAAQPTAVASAQSPRPTAPAAPTAAAAPSAATPKIWTGVYSAAQAKRGEAEFERVCATCHGVDLQGSAGRGPALTGAPFMTNWETDSVANLFTRLKTTMPRNNPSTLTDDVYLDLLTYVLKRNNYPEGAADLKPAGMADVALVNKDGSGKKGVQNFAMVGIVGCLAQAGNRWVLTNTTEPQASKDDAATSAEGQVAAARPVGGETYRLVSAQGFDPARHQGHQVYVKGLVNRVPNDNRLNVTGLQSLASSCPQPR